MSHSRTEGFSFGHHCSILMTAVCHCSHHWSTLWPRVCAGNQLIVNPVEALDEDGINPKHGGSGCRHVHARRRWRRGLRSSRSTLRVAKSSCPSVPAQLTTRLFRAGGGNDQYDQKSFGVVGTVHSVIPLPGWKTIKEDCNEQTSTNPEQTLGLLPPDVLSYRRRLPASPAPS